MQMFQHSLHRFQAAPEPTVIKTLVPPKSQEDWLKEGDAFCDLNQYEETIKAYGEAIKLDPTNALVHRGKGDALLNLKRYKNALIAYEEAIRLNPNYATAYSNKVFMLTSLMRYEEAIQLDPRTSSLSGAEVGPRTLHIIWILDASVSMNGRKIQALNIAIRGAIPELKSVAQSNPQAQVMIRAITFSSGARWHILQPTPLNTFQWPDINAGGKRDMGKALQMVADELTILPMETRNISPVLILITDGDSTDNAEQGIQAILDKPWGRRAVRLGIGIGSNAPYELLQKFINNPEVPPLHACDIEQIANYIRWGEDEPVI